MLKVGDWVEILKGKTESEYMGRWPTMHIGEEFEISCINGSESIRIIRNPKGNPLVSREWNIKRTAVKKVMHV